MRRRLDWYHKMLSSEISNLLENIMFYDFSWFATKHHFYFSVLTAMLHGTRLTKCEYKEHETDKYRIYLFIVGFLYIAVVECRHKLLTMANMHKYTQLRIDTYFIRAISSS